MVNFDLHPGQEERVSLPDAQNEPTSYVFADYSFEQILNHRQNTWNFCGLYGTANGLSDLLVSKIASHK